MLAQYGGTILKLYCPAVISLKYMPNMVPQHERGTCSLITEQAARGELVPYSSVLGSVNLLACRLHLSVKLALQSADFSLCAVGGN